MKVHNPETVSAVVEPFTSIYSHAVETQLNGCRQLHISGQVGESPLGKTDNTFAGQFKQALKNVESILTSADMTKQHIIKVIYYLTRQQDLEELVSIRSDVWRGVHPAVTVVIVAGLAIEDWFVEVDVIAQEEYTAF